MSLLTRQRPSQPVAAPAVLDATAPFHAVVAQVQTLVDDGVDTVVLDGAGAAGVASRLLRLLRGGISVIVRLEPVRTDEDAARAALDAVALAGIAGGRAILEVRTRRELPRVLDAVREALRHPTSSATRFGGDAFTATIRLPWPVEVDVRVVREAVALPLAA